jgi:hypothetical protein
MDFQLTRDGFTSWLQLHPPDGIASEVCDSEDCPLAQYFMAYGFRTLKVTGGSIVYYDDRDNKEHVITKLPSWVSPFISKIDEPYDLCDNAKQPTYGDCLRVLAEIPE